MELKWSAGFCLELLPPFVDARRGFCCTGSVNFWAMIYNFHRPRKDAAVIAGKRCCRRRKYTSVVENLPLSDEVRYDNL